MQSGIAVGGLLGGFAVGLTGMGGGALLTPMLVLFFNVPPSAAVGSDLLASLAMKPVGGAVHAKARTVRTDIVRWLCLGSIPGALVGSIGVSLIESDVADRAMRQALGVALLLAAVAMWLRWRQIHQVSERAGTRDVPVRKALTAGLGFAGGIAVGVTSVGSGSLMIVVLAALYPALTRSELVGTDLVQAIPLVGAAAVGHLLFGEVRLGVALPLLIGALPGTYIGARISASRSPGWLRHVIPVLLGASGLKLVGAF